MGAMNFRLQKNKTSYALRSALAWETHTSMESTIAWDSADKLLRHFRDNFHDFHSIIPTGASSPLCKAWEEAYIKYPPCEEPYGLTPHAASLNTPQFRWSKGIAWIWIGNVSSRCACRTSCVCCVSAAYAGFAVSLAGRDTVAERSTREFVESHCRAPFISRNGFNPIATNLLFPLSFYSVGGDWIQRSSVL